MYLILIKNKYLIHVYWEIIKSDLKKQLAGSL